MERSTGAPSVIFIDVVLAEYARLQDQCAHERETRDQRVNWYTLIIGGVVVGYGVLADRFKDAIAQPSLRAFATILGVAFLLAVGWEVFEGAQRFNLNVIACLMQMERIRIVLAEVDPELERKLHWAGDSKLRYRQPLWVPTVTLTINSFLVALITAMATHDHLIEGVWQLVAILAGSLSAGSQLLYARARYRQLLRRFP